MRGSLAHTVLVLLLLFFPFRSLACPVEVAFSPDRGATDLVVKTISEAKRPVRVAAYSFTSKPIAEALLDDEKRGIDVRVGITSAMNLIAKCRGTITPRACFC